MTKSRGRGSGHFGGSEKALRIAIVLTLLFFVIEIFGSVLSGSLSLLGDAGHMFADVFSLLLSYAAINLAKKVPTRTRTFGYHRVEVFAALFNGITLFGMSGYIFWAAYHRFLTPGTIQTDVMFSIAFVGLLANVYVAYQLHGSHDLNVRSAYMHVLTDLLSSIAVIAASLWIHYTGQTIIDPLLGAGISIFVLFSAVRITRESGVILLEFTPPRVDLDDVIREVEAVHGVDGVHDVHLWTLCPNINVLDAHIYTREKDMASVERIKRQIKKRLLKYDIKHSTLEFECEECLRDERINRIHH